MTSFEWDERKNIENIVKHGIAFEDAQYAFFDSKRIIIEDLSHSIHEERFYCIGDTDIGIVTVRFTFRLGVYVSLEQAFGEKLGDVMNKKITYTDEPVVLGKRVDDLLPPPSALVPKEDNMRVTLELSRKSVNFFKHEAEENKVSYQRMIRAVLDQYADMYISD